MEFLENMLSGRGHKYVSDFPDDAYVVDVRMCDDDWDQQMFSIIVRSDEWEPTLGGHTIPVLDLVFETFAGSHLEPIKEDQ